MIRIVTIWCADWPVRAAGFASDVAAAVVSAGRIVACTPAAADHGVLVGQRRRHAQRCCPSIELIDHDPQRDARGFEPIVRAVVEVSPRLDVVEPGWIAFGARGPSRYLGGDAAMAARLLALVAGPGGGAGVGPGAGVGVGVADGRFASGIAARLAARRGRPVLVEPGGSPGFCAPLSIGWLQTLGESTPETIELFHRLGLRRLGDLAALDATDVMGRFGPPGAHVHRLASGLDGRPPSTVDPAPDRTRSVRLDEPLVQLESLVFVAKRLADDLVGSLSTEGRVCTRLVVELETEHGERSERSWYRSGGLSAAAMVERVRWQLDAWINLPRGSEHEITGGVVVVRLVPDEVTADDGVQQGLWGGQSDADRRATRAIARLSTIVADEVVTVPVWCGGRLPQERFRWVPASTTDLAARHRMRDVTWPGELPSPSPATVLTDPIPIELLGEDGRSMQVSGRGAVSSRPAALRVSRGDEASGWVLGAPQQIRAWAGPWPIEERWWDPTRARRQARFQVMIDDGTAYLVVVEDRRWWITAIYD